MYAKAVWKTKIPAAFFIPNSCFTVDNAAKQGEYRVKKIRKDIKLPAVKISGTLPPERMLSTDSADSFAASPKTAAVNAFHENPMGEKTGSEHFPKTAMILCSIVLAFVKSKVK